MDNNNSSRENSNSNHPDLLRDQPMRRQPDEGTPLISNDLVDTNAPLAKFENFDELEVSSLQPRFDDGLFEQPLVSTNGADEVDGPHGSQPGKPLFLYAPEFVPGGSGLDLETIPDVNIYQHKKTVAQGMMDLALFSANANQLRYVMENRHHTYYYPGIMLISISLLFQVLVGIGLLLNTRYNVKDQKEIYLANKINNFTIVGIFLVTVINVFISAFGVATDSSGGNTSPSEKP